MKETNDDEILLGLLSSGTVAEAARKCGLSERTIYRRLSDKEFLTQWRDARRAVFETSISQLQLGTGKAAQILLQCLEEENPVTRIRAAKLILEHSRFGVVDFDILERSDRLIAILDSREKR
jgi:AcrR family transcriptional regulator